MIALYAKSLADRWRTMAVAVLVIALWLPLAMAVYRDIDLSIYENLPEGIRQLMGIPTGADAATLAYNVMLEFAGALALAGVAVSVGSGAIAGEERAGTLGLLLAHPLPRRRALAAKLAALVTLVVIGTAGVYTVSALAPRLLGIEIGETHLGAMAVHLGLNALFWGTVALAVGSWTGDRTRASGLAAVTMAVSYVAVGLLPLIDALSGIARLFPWYYFSDGAPLVNGLRAGNLAVLAIASATLALVSFVGLDRRDLRSRNVGTSLLDRLRTNAHTQRVFEGLAGSTRVSRLWIKTTSEHQAVVVVTALSMFLFMGVLMGPMYTAIDDDIATVAEDFPDAVLALAGNGDLSTPEGWFQVETFSLMAPIAVMIVTIVIGARSLAGEEANRTISLLLANPIPRSRLVTEAAIAMAALAAIVGTATFAGVTIASIISGLGMSIVGIAAASILTTLLGLVFGALALLLGAATGRTRIAVLGSCGAALTSYLLNAFLPLSDSFSAWARLSPNHYSLSGEPLQNGMQWGHAAVLIALTTVQTVLATLLFARRDLRSG